MVLTGYRVFSHVVAVGMIVGAAAAPVPGRVHAELTLLSADGPLSGSQTAIIVGGTTEPTPSTAFAQTAEDLYLRPLGFDGGATDSTVCDMSGTDPCSAVLQALATPELIPQGQSTLAGASDIVAAVENEFAANPGAFSAEHPLTVFGYSQGAAASSIAMTQLAQAGIPSSALHFVFIGNPDNPGGSWPNLEPDLATLLGPTTAHSLLDFLGFNGALGFVTPDDLYPATIYTLATDGIGDFQKDFQAGGIWGAIEHFAVQHVEYLGLTPEQVATATTSTDGDLTNIYISDDIDNAGAWFNSFDHGVADDGLLQSLIGSLEWALQAWF